MTSDHQQLTLSHPSPGSALSLHPDGAASGRAAFAGQEDADEPEDSAESIAAVSAGDFRLEGDRALAKGWKRRAADNIAAIRLLLAIEQAGRVALPEEQQRLIRFTGFGASALATALFPRPGEPYRARWETLGQKLSALLSPAERAGLASTTQYAHFTPEWLVRAIWCAVQRLGFAGGQVLEPGCGAGLFLALVPAALAPRCAFTGIEIDPITARIARLLFPHARIRQEDLTKARLPQSFDLAIGNPPFSDRSVRGGDSLGRLGLALHDAFLARSLERLRPGALAAFVTSRWTLDKADPTARRHLAGMADLVGAVRLPEGSLSADAGTEVVVDLLFFQRRAEGSAPGGLAWGDLVQVQPAGADGPALLVNRCLAERPEAVLGRHARSSGPFGPAYTCRPLPGVDLRPLLAQALATLPRGIATPPGGPKTRPTGRPPLAVGTAAEGAELKEGSYLLDGDGILAQVVDGAALPVPVRAGRGTKGIPARHAAIIRALIPVRDALRAVLQAQAVGAPWGPAQTRLRVAYAGFERRFGPINRTTASDTDGGESTPTGRRPNLAPFLDDPDAWLVASIEEHDPESGRTVKGPVFTERVLHPPATPVIVTAADALAVSLHERGVVDLDRIALLLGCDRARALSELGDAVFQDPQTGCWETADAYLSGPVRRKLALARAAAALDPAVARNVAALERVQPDDLRPSQITARLGAPWIPAEAIERFVREVVGVATRVRHTIEVAAWSLDQRSFERHAAATTAWGTGRRHAGLLLDDALNGALPQIWNSWTEDGREHRELDGPATEAAREKLTRLEAAFAAWVWTEPGRADRLARIYNERFNNLVPRHFDGSHLQLPGAARVVELYPHQKRAVWRIVASGSTYLAHPVGAGKTYALVAAIMEQRRLGLITKAMLVVPGHCLAQAARELLQLYPQARILVADETSFAARRRLRFLARAATARWDAIVITHSAFKLIPAPAGFERQLIGQQLQAYEELLARVDGDDRMTRKRIERLKEGFAAKLEALRGRKDDMLTFDLLGIDQLIVDEAQEFRKLAFATNMAGLKGVDPDGSQRAWDLYVKARLLGVRQPGRALILASGTPITNTLGELYTLQRFLQPQALEERGVHAFDAWAASFGATRSELELQPSGRYQPVARFAEFVNLPELVAMFRSVADVVSQDELRRRLPVPRIKGGARTIVTAAPSAGFKAYQARLEQRITAIERRRGRPEKGQDILLSVITDGRHAAIDLRLVEPAAGNEPANKLNLLIENVQRIWHDTAGRVYLGADGLPLPIRGAGQLVFSDLGTPSAEAARGFSAYRWIKDQLVRRGVPAAEIAFMQDHRTSEARQRLLAAVNAGRVRILVGSTATMGTGINVQARLAALHHLDVPWLPALIEQREGRILRQGNPHAEVEILAYATLGSMDAPLWQANERKARFIAAALAGEATLRTLDEAPSQAGQFALAKAIASGDPRLLRKAGLESGIARLERLRAAHLDEQLAIRRRRAEARATLEQTRARIAAIEADLARRVATRGAAFSLEVEGRRYRERKAAGDALLLALRRLERDSRPDQVPIAALGGFALTARVEHAAGVARVRQLILLRSGGAETIELDEKPSARGLVTRLERRLERFEAERAEQHRIRTEALRRLADDTPRLGVAFSYQGELDHQRAVLAALDAELATNAAA